MRQYRTFEKSCPWLGDPAIAPSAPIVVASVDSDRRGAIERVRDGRLYGWVQAVDGTGSSSRLALDDGDEELLQFVPGDLTESAGDLPIEGARLPFSLELPDRVFDGREHRLVLRPAGDGTPIAGSATRLTLTRDLGSPGPSEIRGRFLGVRGIVAEGWAYDAANPDRDLVVEVLVGQQPIASGVANLVREDLDAPGDARIDCGFRIRIPNSLLDGRPLLLKARDAGTGIAIDSDAEQTLEPDQSGWLVRIGDLEGQTLVGQVEIETADAQDGIELDLWIDGIWADRFQVGPTASKRQSIPFRHPIPETVRDGDTWTSILDGEMHELLLAPADTSRVLDAVELPTPVKTYTHSALRIGHAGPLDRLPRFVRRFIARAAASVLFDRGYYAAQARASFASGEQALLHYLSDPKQWRHPTSRWMDVAFVSALAGAGAQGLVSPLEWYLRQGAESDVGPNPWFSNADYCLFAGYAENGRPKGPSYFDDWVEAVAGGTPTNPSALVDIEHLSEQLSPGGGFEGGPALQYLQDWVQTTPKRRSLHLLGPYLHQDWLEQCFILKHNRPRGCALTAFRLAHLVDQSPHPVLQSSRNGQDYYGAIRDYERLVYTSGTDDITRVCPEIDFDAFYTQLAPDAADSAKGREGRSGFRRYLAASPDSIRKSFLRGLEDGFVEHEYPGLIDYCRRQRGVADINLIWSRWLRLLGVPGAYADSVLTENGLLPIQDLKLLRGHRCRLDRGVAASFIVPTYGRDDLVLRCVLSAVQAGGLDRVEVLIAEDAAHVDSSWILGYFLPYATIYKNPENLGFLLSCREAVSRSGGAIFILVNNDVIVHKDAIAELVQTFESRSDAAVVGGLVLNADGSVQENSGMLWKDASAWNYHRGWKLADEYAFNIREADYVSGCWIGIRRAAWEALGGFDVRYVPAYYEESDFCLSCWRHGYRVYVNPLSVVTHLDGATMGQDEDNTSSLKSYQRINRQKFQRKWKGLLESTHHENGKPTAFHTGRSNPKRFISIVFDHYIPEPDRDAGSRTMLVVCEALAALRDNYVLFVPANNHRSKYAAALERQGIEVVTGAEGWKRLDHLLDQDHRLVRYCFVSRIGVAEKFTWHINKLRCRKSLYIHDIEALRGFQHDASTPGHDDLVNAAVEKYARKHAQLFSLFDDIVSLSEDETRLLQPYFGRKLVDVFPYDFPETDLGAIPAQRNDIIFVGSYNHPPNREAIAYFIERIWPEILESLPSAILHLCGSGFESADFVAGRNIVRHGMVSDRTLAYLYSISRVAIAPLLTGAGMKGKVIEACSHAVPCVGTEVAWQGIPLPQELSLLTGSLSSFAQRLLEVYEASDAETRARLRQLYQGWRERNRMIDVLPKLIRASVAR